MRTFVFELRHRLWKIRKAAGEGKPMHGISLNDAFRRMDAERARWERTHARKTAAVRFLCGR